ncbi:transposase [Streptococcus azizii]|uniref:Transposase n=2 Tax=Streptococcus TaxID=1301 RepID=A0AB36JPC1_9STRE|nr:transposase [Streptococcus sp. 19428wD3_AN2]ONK26487.1 transposase [Streptococcus azizii]ONK26736.1 transposase [Streptococcus azizii]ONK27014.1 transposase [Streptococcus azizii]TFU82798.1 transposase [Streptococcus sp. AN2]
MSLENIEAARPVGWTIDKNNGFVHIKDENGTFRIKLDPPDWRTDYPHMHIYDENENLLDINGNIVNRRSPEGHIPWNNGGN